MQPANIAVFGSSEPLAGEPLYDRARAVGRLLATDGHTVVTGGYGGVMEGASRGAREAGGRAVGVTSRIFDHRRPNAWLSEIVRSDDLHDRQRKLIELCRGFVVLEGKSGTLAELSLLWALHRAGCLEPSPVILLGESWAPFLISLDRSNMLDAPQLQLTRTVATPEEAAAALRGWNHPAEGPR